MRYYRRLAYRLRRRGLSEIGVSRVLSEVRDLSTASAKAPQEEFGPADAYAETFGKGTARWTLSRCANWVARLTAHGFVILNVELRRQGEQMLLPWWAGLGTWFAVLACGEVARFALDHRLPRAFTLATVPRSRISPPDQPPPAGKAPQADGAGAAEQFDRHTYRYGTAGIVFLACVLTASLIQVINMTADLRGGGRLLRTGPSLLTYAALFVGGASFAVLYEHRLPRTFPKIRPRRHRAAAGG